MNLLCLVLLVLLGTAFAVPDPAISSDFNTKMLPNTTVCGLPSLDDRRILGGEVTNIGEFPWTVALEYRERSGKDVGPRCGGSLINQRYILTSASCLSNRMLELAGVRLGEWNLSTDPDCMELIANIQCAHPIKKVKVEKIILYPSYNGRNGHHDIGLIRLERDVEYTDYVRPICLPSPSLLAPKNGTLMTVAGWGRTESDSASDIQLKVKVPVVENEVCKKRLNNSEIIPQQLCAGGVIGEDSCHGDGGQPLMRIHDEEDQMRWFQYGITSRGYGCGREGYPSIYTRVSSYVNWIADVMAED